MAIGRRLGNYDIERELGRGGMGAVYVGKHQLLGRAAAVKILQAHYSKDQDVVKRFFNEARAATAIKHPSIVEIFDFGFADDGSAYIVMELCDGESLGARLKRLRVLSVPTALAITRQIAGALAAAHKAGIIHRDLKPDNVFLVPDPEVVGGERIKLLDFGIAKLAGDSSGPSATQTGAILGTPYYMSPEQCRGAGHVDQRADLYSLGCILFEMVCGRVPFVGEGAGEIIGAHLHVAPPKPSAMSASVPAEVEALILSLLAKKADERPARADLVVSAIHAIAGTTPAPVPVSDTFGLMTTAAGSEPGKKSSPAVSGYGDTLGSGQQLAVPSALGSSPGVPSLDSTQPSGPLGASPGTDVTAPPAAPDRAPDVAMSTPAPIAATPVPMADMVVASTPVPAIVGSPSAAWAPKRNTARMSAQVPPMPFGQRIIVFALIVAGLAAVAGAVLMWPRVPKRIAHKVTAEAGNFGFKDTRAELVVEDPSKPDDVPIIRATVINGPADLVNEPEAFALVEDGKVRTELPALSVTPIADSTDTLSIVVLVQGSEDWIGARIFERNGAPTEERVIDRLNKTFATANFKHLPTDTDITFMQYSDVALVTLEKTNVHDMTAHPLGGMGSYNGRTGRALSIGATRAIDTLVNTYSNRKVLIVIGDGMDSNEDYAKTALKELAKRAADHNILVLGVVYSPPTADFTTGADLMIKHLIPLPPRVSSVDELGSAIAGLLTKLDDRYYVRFAAYNPAGHFGLSLDGKEHDLVVRVADEELDAISVSLPRWRPPLGSSTRSVILAAVALVLFLAALGLALRGRRQRQLLAIPRA